MQALEVLAILADRVHQNLSDRTSPPIFQCGKVRQFEIIIINTYSSIKFIFFYHALLWEMDTHLQSLHIETKSHDKYDDKYNAHYKPISGIPAADFIRHKFSMCEWQC